MKKLYADCKDCDPAETLKYVYTAYQRAACCYEHRRARGCWNCRLWKHYNGFTGCSIHLINITPDECESWRAK